MGVGGERILGLCLSRSHPFQGLPSARRPECGREFDPSDPATMNMGRVLTPLVRWLPGPIGKQVTPASCGTVAFALWSARRPGGQVRDSVLLSILTGLGEVGGVVGGMAGDAAGRRAAVRAAAVIALAGAEAAGARGWGIAVCGSVGAAAGAATDWGCRPAGRRWIGWRGG